MLTEKQLDGIESVIREECVENKFADYDKWKSGSWLIVAEKLYPLLDDRQKMDVEEEAGKDGFMTLWVTVKTYMGPLSQMINDTNEILKREAIEEGPEL